MSKMDGLRAMREARYEQAKKRSGTSATTPRTAPKAPTAPKVAAKPAASEREAQPDGAQDAEALCGHRNMSGRTCTREHGHAAKSHRYS